MQVRLRKIKTVLVIPLSLPSYMHLHLSRSPKLSCYGESKDARHPEWRVTSEGMATLPRPYDFTQSLMSYSRVSLSWY